MEPNALFFYLEDPGGFEEGYVIDLEKVIANEDAEIPLEREQEDLLIDVFRMDEYDFTRSEFSEHPIDYHEYSIAREGSRDLDLQFPHIYDLAETALQVHTETVLSDRYSYKDGDSESVDELCEFGENLDPGEEESRENFLEKAEEFDISELIRIDRFREDLKVVPGHTEI
ncbi:MAG: hypothetical protein ABEJ99_05240 [Candidatus Nanohaloarchaea archaeon]